MQKHISFGGYEIKFEDQPHRLLTFLHTDVRWSAQLTLINKGLPVFRVNYGFTSNVITGSHLLPVTYQIFH